MTPAALRAAERGEMENFIAATTPGGIEAQEKNGQIEQSFTETLPKAGTEGSDRAAFEALGFVFGEPADDIFLNVKFPAGWRKKATDHSMWSELLDDKGRKRGMIFYKAAFYDRSAHCHLTRRFDYSCYEEVDEPNVRAVVIRDAGITSETLGTYEPGDRAKSDELEAAALKWLADKYPNWKELGAYWD